MNQSSLSKQEEMNVFEILDFTSVSDFERLVNSIESFVEELTKLIQQKATVSDCKSVLHGNITISYYCLSKNALSIPSIKKNPFVFTNSVLVESEFPMDTIDFPFVSTPMDDICRWYGVSEYIHVISQDPEYFNTPETVKLYLSAFAVALENIHSSIPVLIQTSSHWKSLFSGYRLIPFESDFYNLNSSEYRYQMSVFPYVIPSYSTLNDLISLFKFRLGIIDSKGFSPSSPSLPVMQDVIVSACFTFDLVLPLSPSSHTSSHTSTYTEIPFGCQVDAIQEILFQVCFPRSLAENYLSLTYLDIWNSNVWSVSCKFKQDLTLIGSGILSRIVQSWLSTLDPIPMGFVDKQDILYLLRFLFDPESYTLPIDLNKSLEMGADIERDKLIHTLERNRVIPKNSFLNHLAMRLVDSASPRPKYLHFDCGLITLVKGLKADLITAFKACWEHGILIPGIDMYVDGNIGIDYQTCLLHQKLVMLNICIRDKLKRQKCDFISMLHHPFLMDENVQHSQQQEKYPVKQENLRNVVTKLADLAVSAVVGPPSPPRLTFQQHTLTLGETEENSKSWKSEQSWIDVVNRKSLDEQDKMDIWKDVKNEIIHDIYEEEDDEEDYVSCVKERIGHLRPFKNHSMLSNRQPIYIPETQECIILTEDALNQQQEDFEKLGTSLEGTRMRAKLQCQALYSDMQAFKAANPGCILADFVRWHSPRDWIVDETSPNEDSPTSKSGHLSERMTRENNLWKELWDAAGSIPASKQKPLFDYESCALNILEYLQDLSIFQFLQFFMPIFFECFLEKMYKDPIPLDFLQTLIHEFTLKYTKIDWKCIGLEDMESLESLLADARVLEEWFCKAQSLLIRFPNEYDFVQRLLLSKDVFVTESEKQLVYDLMKSKALALSLDALTPSFREYILQTCISKFKSRSIPQRLYALLKEGEFRIVETFGLDGLS